MNKSPVFIVLSLLAGLTNFDPPNQPPVVKIQSPVDKTLTNLSAQVHYQISVSDKEDGDTQFDEINTKEVMLQIRYFTDLAGANSERSKPMQADPHGLTLIRSSNCLNCHNFNSKSIGPSYFEISSRYPENQTIVDLLAKHIREGSSGVWGKVSMPTHPELTTEDAKSIVSWILQNSSKSAQAWYSGTEGSFSLPLFNEKPGYYLLTASYLDHGLKDQASMGIRSEDKIVIQTKP